MHFQQMLAPGVLSTDIQAAPIVHFGSHRIGSISSEQARLDSIKLQLEKRSGELEKRDAEIKEGYSKNKEHHAHLVRVHAKYNAEIKQRRAEVDARAAELDAKTKEDRAKLDARAAELDAKTKEDRAELDARAAELNAREVMVGVAVPIGHGQKRPRQAELVFLTQASEELKKIFGGELDDETKQEFKKRLFAIVERDD
jgi:chromosome segregation ATPase